MQLIIKGIIIGIGKVLPGISGSMIAIMLGEYEKIIYSISKIEDNLKENFMYLSKIGIGIIISISILSKIIVKSLNNFYFPTILLFVGVIIGDIIEIDKIKKLTLNKNEIYKLSKKIIIIITIFIIYNKINYKIITKTTIRCQHSSFVNFMIVGAIESIASIVPGISGTVILLSIGYYNIILEAFSSLYSHKRINDNIHILIPFFLGFIIGTLITSKIICKINKNTKRAQQLKTIFEIISIYAIVEYAIRINKTRIDLIIGIWLCILGLITSMSIKKKIIPKNKKNKI